MKKYIILILLFLVSVISSIAQNDFIDFHYRQTTYGDTDMPTLEEHHRIIYNNQKAILYDVTHTRVSNPFYFRQSLNASEFTWYYYEDEYQNALMIEVYGRFAVFMEQYNISKKDWTTVTLFTKTHKL